MTYKGPILMDATVPTQRTANSELSVFIGWIKREKSPEYVQGRGLKRFFVYQHQRPGYRMVRLVIGEAKGDISGYVRPAPIDRNFYEVAFTLKQGRNNIPAVIQFVEESIEHEQPSGTSDVSDMCEPLEHADPDNSGMCIKCGYPFDEIAQSQP